MIKNIISLQTQDSKVLSNLLKYSSDIFDDSEVIAHTAYGTWSEYLNQQKSLVNLSTISRLMEIEDEYGMFTYTSSSSYGNIAGSIYVHYIQSYQNLLSWWNGVVYDRNYTFENSPQGASQDVRTEWMKKKIDEATKYISLLLFQKLEFILL